MRVALVGPTYPLRGGISHYTTLLCRALARQHDVRFLALERQYPPFLFPGTRQTDESSEPLTAPNEPCLDPWNPLSWLATAGRIRRIRPDLVLFSWWHPFFAPAFGTVARLARRHGIPSCFLCHNVRPHESSPLDTLLLRYAFGGGASFVTHSRSDAELLERLCPGARVRQSPHPTYEVFVTRATPTAEAAKAALSLSGKRVLLFFGFVRSYKGLEHFLRAMKLLEPDEGYHALIAGEFYEKREKYQADLDLLSARGQLTLVDRYVPNERVPEYFAAADLVVAPYVEATQSGTVQMAYGFGKPVIASRVGGIPEVVEDGATGYLVPPADPSAIAIAARRFFASDDPVRFAANIRRARQLYSWDRMVETIEATARDLSSRRANP